MTSLEGAQPANSKPLPHGRRDLLVRGKGYILSGPSSRSDYRDSRCRAPGVLVPDGASLTLAAGPATLGAGEGSDKRGEAMRVEVDTALEKSSA